MAHHETENGVWTSKFRGQKLEMFSARYYAACAAGGLVSAGSAHFIITPFDVLKVNMQEQFGCYLCGDPFFTKNGVWNEIELCLHMRTASSSQR